MARARNIKPGFFKNEVLGVSDPLHSLLFIGLWLLADREGRLQDRPLKIKGEVFPHRTADVDSLLNWLHSNDFITRYVVNGERLIQVWKFKKHQHPHVNEPASELPAPDEHHTSTVRAPEWSGANPSDFLITDSLITDSLIPESFRGLPATLSNGSETADKPTETKPTEKANGKAPTASPPAESKPTASSYPQDFEIFWNAYPYRGGRRRGKQKTFSLWKLVPVADRQLVVLAATNYAASRDAKEGYARDPERFFKSEWWREWLDGEVELDCSRVPTAEDDANWNPVDGGLKS